MSAWSMYRVSFDGSRSKPIRATSAADAVTASAVDQYPNVSFFVSAVSSGRVLWRIANKDNGALLGFATVHKGQRA